MLLPATVPSTRKSTWSTATLSEAVAVIGTVPATLAPLVGDVSDTVGGVVSAVPVGFESAIPRSSTVKKPFELMVRPKLRPVTPAGMA